MQLRQLACDDHVLRNPKDRLDIPESVQNAVGRFIKNVSRLAPNEFFKGGLPLSRLGRKKAVENKLLGRQATGDEAADRRIRAGNRENIDTGGDGRSGDLASWVSNSRRAGVADDGNPSAQLQLRR